MNTEDDTNAVDIDLDEFESEFYSTAKSEVVEDKEEVKEVTENEEDSPLATEPEDEPDVEENDEDEDSEEEEEVEEVPQPKQKRNRAQERIEKLLERERLANERAEALEKRLAALEAEKEVKSEEKPLREALPADAPDPDAVDAEGNPIYELGEFDKQYIRDLTKWTIEQEAKAAKEQAAAEAREAERKAVEMEIQEKWIDNLDKAEAEIPEIRENIRELTEVFQDVEPQYGEYLAMSIMSNDYGPHIMNYLSQNIGEAQKIVASGPAAATFELGAIAERIKLSSKQEEKRNTKQVSKAPEPPEDRVRGRGGRFAVAPDTDDLDAFERAFF